MVGCIAHEIRNPLGSVELFASLLRKDLRDQPQLKTYAEHISVAVQSMDRLLSNLLVYTKPDCSKAGWQDTEQLIREVLTLASHAMAPASIEVCCRVDSQVSRLWCDGGKMKQVLLNLVLNAVQAMPNGGRLTITATAAQHQLRSPLNAPHHQRYRPRHSHGTCSRGYLTHSLRPKIREPAWVSQSCMR